MLEFLFVNELRESPLIEYLINSIFNAKKKFNFLIKEIEQKEQLSMKEFFASMTKKALSLNGGLEILSKLDLDNILFLNNQKLKDRQEDNENKTKSSKLIENKNNSKKSIKKESRIPMKNIKSPTHPNKLLFECSSRKIAIMNKPENNNTHQKPKKPNSANLNMIRPNLYRRLFVDNPGMANHWLHLYQQKTQSKKRYEFFTRKLYRLSKLEIQKESSQINSKNLSYLNVSKMSIDNRLKENRHHPQKFIDANTDRHFIGCDKRSNINRFNLNDIG